MIKKRSSLTKTKISLIPSVLEHDYKQILEKARHEIHTARANIARQLNRATTSVYWNLGQLLSEKQLTEGYGSGVVRQLSLDLKKEFPNMGLSTRNLWDMKRFYERYLNADIKLRQAVAVLPWGHNLLLMNKVQSDDQVKFYAAETLNKGWSRDLLLNAIKMETFNLRAKPLKSHNFEQALSIQQAEYANEVFKNTYNLGFLEVTEPLTELQLEKRLVQKVKSFILELGKGFSFIGNQYRLEYNKKEYYVDLLFFHRGLRSLVAIELKIGGFKAEYIGKMNLYLSLLDNLEKRENENRSIGIILCADKDHLDVEIALQGIDKPIGVAEYQMLIPKKELESVIVKELQAAEKSKRAHKKSDKK